MENNFNEEQVLNRMSRYQFSIIHLQDEDLPADFGNYLRQERFKYILLHGPRKIVKCKLLLGNHPKKSNKIGSGWKEFCTAHGFDQSIDLVFEVDQMKNNQNVKVLTYCNL
ncbi:hypothetical protein DEO72_LG2g2371 [Vigna unguiculata]|uniref:TF-B3 domain-containing protein n=1 Tax=Vigna unguiculata TaxID=3917 RepID=A0A4D6KW77_VIGUN|nr:hypothetical protein DEO72_LG2g2371 [Vigna unguiculata]